VGGTERLLQAPVRIVGSCIVPAERWTDEKGQERKLRAADLTHAPDRYAH
jgi:hypothetical protein